MPANNTARQYGAVTKTFHWLTALLILTVIPLGAIANRLPFDTNEQLALKAQLFSFHKTLGVIIFLVALARILWALSQTKPGGLHPDRKAETLLAELVHWLLYLSLVAVPLTGWIHHAATTGFAPLLLPFGESLPFVPKSEPVAELFSTLHWIWSKIMVAAILLHVAGAIKHQAIDKDATLRRMWFGNASAPEVAAHQTSLVAPAIALVIYVLATGAGVAAGLFAQPTDTAASAIPLESVASDWTVTEGEIAITVTQLGNPVIGSFADWTSAITFDPNATGVAGDVITTINIASLQLGSVTEQAMGADFFAAETYPTAIFSGTITRADVAYQAEGTLRIKDAVVPVTLPFTLEIDGETARMAGTITLDRRDFAIGQSLGNETNLAFGVTVDLALTATRGMP